MQPINSNQRVFDNTCAICLEETNTPTRITVEKCHHIFHRTCLSTWEKVSSTCPNCRGPLVNSSERVNLLNNEDYVRLYNFNFRMEQLWDLYLEPLDRYPITHENIDLFRTLIRQKIHDIEIENSRRRFPDQDSIRSAYFLRRLNRINPRFNDPEQFKASFRDVCKSHFGLLSFSNVRDNPDFQMILRLRRSACPESLSESIDRYTLGTVGDFIASALLVFVICRIMFIYGPLRNGRMALSPADKVLRKFFSKVLFVDLPKLP